MEKKGMMEYEGETLADEGPKVKIETDLFNNEETNYLFESEEYPSEQESRENYPLQHTQAKTESEENYPSVNNQSLFDNAVKCKAKTDYPRVGKAVSRLMTQAMVLDYKNNGRQVLETDGVVTYIGESEGDFIVKEENIWKTPSSESDACYPNVKDNPKEDNIRICPRTESDASYSNLKESREEGGSESTGNASPRNFSEHESQFDNNRPTRQANRLRNRPGKNSDKLIENSISHLKNKVGKETATEATIKFTCRKCTSSFQSKRDLTKHLWFHNLKYSRIIVKKRDTFLKTRKRYPKTTTVDAVQECSSSHPSNKPDLCSEKPEDILIEGSVLSRPPPATGYVPDNTYEDTNIPPSSELAETLAEKSDNQDGRIKDGTYPIVKRLKKIEVEGDCQDCGKSFREKHFTTCAIFKIYKCHLCDLKFKFQSKLKQHIRIHKNSVSNFISVQDQGKRSSKDRSAVDQVKRSSNDMSTVEQVQQSNNHSSTVGLVQKSNNHCSMVGLVQQSNNHSSMVGFVQQSRDHSSTVDLVQQSNNHSSTVGLVQQSNNHSSTVGLVQQSTNHSSTVGLVQQSTNHSSTVGLVQQSTNHSSTVGLVQQSTNHSSTVGLVQQSTNHSSTVGLVQQSTNHSSMVGLVQQSNNLRSMVGLVQQSNNLRSMAHKLGCVIMNQEKVPVLSERSTSSVQKEAQYNRVTIIKPRGTYRRIYKCTTCSVQFEGISKAMSHASVHLGNEWCTHLENRIEKNYQMRGFQCLLCTKLIGKIQYKEYRNRHAVHYHFECMICHEHFVDKSDFIDHDECHDEDIPYLITQVVSPWAPKKSMEVLPPRFECRECHQAFDQRPLLASHSVTAHPSKFQWIGAKIKKVEFRCVECKLNILCQAAYFDHLLSHSGPK